MYHVVPKDGPSIPPTIVDMRRCPKKGASLRLSECVRCDWCYKLKFGKARCKWGLGGMLHPPAPHIMREVGE